MKQCDKENGVLLIVSSNTQKVVLTKSCNSEIPGLGYRQSWDSGFTKTATILRLQSVLQKWNYNVYIYSTTR